MRKISLIFALALMIVGVKAETLTETFDNVTVTDRTTLSNGWLMVYNGTSNYYGFGGSYDYQIKSGNYDGNEGNSLYCNYSDDKEFVVIPTKLTGTFTYYAKRSASSNGTITFYEATKSGDSFTVTSTQLSSTSTSSSWGSQKSFELGEGGKYVAICLKQSRIDQIEATIYEEPTVEGAALAVYDGSTEITSGGSVEFGVTTAGATKELTLLNPGNADIDISISIDGGFTINAESMTIKAGEQETLVVTMPNATNANGFISITSESLSETFVIVISGQIVPVMELYLGETVMTNGYADKFGKVTENTTHPYTVKNTGTAALNVAIASDNTEFTVNPANLEVAVDGEATFEVTFNYNAENVGARNANITLTPADNYNTALTFTATANIADPNVWSEDFEAKVIPEGWESTDETYWSVSDGVAHGKYATGSTKYYLTTPALEVKAGDELTFNYKRSNAKMVIEKQMNGDGNWTTLEAGGSYTTDSEWQTYTISGLEAGIYQFRFANDDYDLDNFEGFKLATLAHNVAITSFNIPTVGYTGDEFVATVTLQEKAGVDEPMWAKLYINGNVVAEANKEVLANTEETLTLTFIPTQAAAYGSKAYIEVYNTNKDFTKKSDEQSVYIQEVSVLEISETTTNTFESGTWDRVKMDYTVREGWNTIALPFIVNDLTVFGESVKAWAFTGYDGNLKFSKVTGSLAAATPYILYVENPTEGKVVFQNVTIYGTSASEEDCKVTQGAATFQGTYSRMMAGEMEGKYGVTPDGEIRVGSANATMKAFRAYFILPEGSKGAKLVIEGVNDDATAIDAVELLGNQDGDIYDLSGRKVSHAQKGIYIQNGKKVVIK